MSDIEDYFEYIIKKHKTIADNPPIHIYVNKINNRIVFKKKTGYKLKLLSEETQRLLDSTKQHNGENCSNDNVPNLESVEVVLMHYNTVKNCYQQASRKLFTFVPNKKFAQYFTTFIDIAKYH